MDYRNLTCGNIGVFMRVAQRECKDADEILERDIDLLAMLKDVHRTDIEALPLKQFSKLRKDLYLMLTNEPKGKYFTVFKCGGKRFRVAQLSSLQVKHEANVQLLRLTPENFYDKLPYIVAIFSEERKLWGKRMTYDERVKHFKDHLSADVGIGITLFFCQAYDKLSPIIATFLESQITKMEAMADEALQTMYSHAGDGQQKSMN
jgi:hypothetical protein